MKKINRIKASREFAITIKNGRTYKTGAYVIHANKNELGYCRIGISVSTKLGTAVVRNRTKRQIRAMCDSLINYTSHTFDLVIIAKQGFFKNNHDNNKKTLNEMLGEIGILK